MNISPADWPSFALLKRLGQEVLDERGCLIRDFDARVSDDGFSIEVTFHLTDGSTLVSHLDLMELYGPKAKTEH